MINPMKAIFMQPDFFNIDVHRNTGERHKSSSKTAVGADRSEIRHSDLPTPGKSFTDALQDAKGASAGDVETTPKPPSFSDAAGDAQQLTVDTDAVEGAVSQAAAPASGVSPTVISKKSRWTAQTALGSRGKTRQGQASPTGHDRPHRNIGRKPFGGRHDSQTDHASLVTPIAAPMLHKPLNGDKAANNSRPEVSAAPSNGGSGADAHRIRTASAHAVPSGRRGVSGRHRHTLSFGRGRMAKEAGPLSMQKAVPGKTSANGGQSAKTTTDDGQHGAQASRDGRIVRNLSPKASSDDAPAVTLRDRSRSGGDGRPVATAQRFRLNEQSVERTIKSAPDAAVARPHRRHVSAEARTRRPAPPSGLSGTRPADIDRHQLPGEAKNPAGTQGSTVDRHGDDTQTRVPPRASAELHTARTAPAPDAIATAAATSGPAAGKGDPLLNALQGGDQQSALTGVQHPRHKAADRGGTHRRADAATAQHTAARRLVSRSPRIHGNTPGQPVSTPDNPTTPRLSGKEKPAAAAKRFTLDTGQTRHATTTNGQPQPSTAQAADRDSSGPGANHRSADVVMDRGSGLPGIARGESAAPQPAAPAAAAPRALPADVMQRITEKAVSMVRNGQDSIKIQLNPASLGHIQLKVATEGQQVMIRMLVENPATRDLLEGNVGLLRAELGQQGLTIDRLDLDLFSGNHTSGQSGNQADKEAEGHLSHRRQKAALQSDEKANAEDTTATASDADNGSTLVGVFA